MKKRGFTLVEIMIVVAIIGLLAAIAIPSFTRIRAESRKSKCQNAQRMLRDAVDQWAMASNAKEGDAITKDDADILAYIKGGADALKCPEGNADLTWPAKVGDNVTCSFPDHTIPTSVAADAGG